MFTISVYFSWYNWSKFFFSLLGFLFSIQNSFYFFFAFSLNTTIFPFQHNCFLSKCIKLYSSCIFCQFSENCENAKLFYDLLILIVLQHVLFMICELVFMQQPTWLHTHTFLCIYSCGTQWFYYIFFYYCIWTATVIMLVIIIIIKRGIFLLLHSTKKPHGWTTIKALVNEPFPNLVVWLVGYIPKWPLKENINIIFIFLYIFRERKERVFICHFI